jgi:hypothetical protein
VITDRLGAGIGYAQGMDLCPTSVVNGNERIDFEPETENPMPARELQEQLTALREQLDQNPPLDAAERDDLHQLMAQIEARINVEKSVGENDINTGINLAVERFEVSHPSLAGSLRNIMVTLGSIGI